MITDACFTVVTIGLPCISLTAVELIETKVLLRDVARYLSNLIALMSLSTRVSSSTEVKLVIGVALLKDTSVTKPVSLTILIPVGSRLLRSTVSEKVSVR